VRVRVLSGCGSQATGASGTGGAGLRVCGFGGYFVGWA